MYEVLEMLAASASEELGTYLVYLVMLRHKRSSTTSACAVVRWSSMPVAMIGLDMVLDSSLWWAVVVDMLVPPRSASR